MRLEKLKLRNVGPFKHVDLDLTQITGKLVAITGPNGAGKTTLAEMFAAAMHRTTPTRGSLASLATARDAMLEATIVGAERWTVTHSIDPVGSKGESLLLNEAGKPVYPDTKVRSFDGWSKRNLPSPEVLFASTFSPQGSAGLLGMKPTPRKQVLLRALGAERLEALAKAAGEHVREAKGDLSTLVARIADERERGGNLETLEAEGEKRGRYLESVTAHLAIIEDSLRAERELAERLRTRGEAHRAYLARRGELEAQAGRLREQGKAIDTALELDRRTVADADEIRAAVVRRDGVIAELRDLEERERACTVELGGLDQKWAEARKAAAAAQARKVEAHRRAKRLGEVLAERGEVEGARLQLPGLKGAMGAAEAPAARAAFAVRELQGARFAGAEERIGGLREGLAGIARVDLARESIGEGGDLARIAEDTLEADDAALAEAAEAPGKLAQAEADAAGLALIAGEASDAYCRADRFQAGKPADYGQVSADLAEAERDASEALAENARLLEVVDPEAAKAGNLAIEETRKAAEIARRVLDGMIGAPERLAALAGAQARIDAREDGQASLAADLGALEAQLEELEVVPKPEALPDVEALELDVEGYREQLQAARSAVTFSDQAIALAEASAERVVELEATQADINVTLSDWTRLATDLGRDGVQALVIDSAGPELTELINDLLRACVGPRWTVTVETTRLGADGKQREGCEIRVLDTERGREAAAETLSGGEGVLVGEAVALALSVLSCRRLGIERPTLVRDESGAALDPSNGRAYIAMLRRAVDLIGADRCLFVSHSAELQGLADARIVVADGTAAIVDGDAVQSWISVEDALMGAAERQVGQ